VLCRACHAATSVRPVRLIYIVEVGHLEDERRIAPAGASVQMIPELVQGVESAAEAKLDWMGQRAFRRASRTETPIALPRIGLEVTYFFVITSGWRVIQTMKHLTRTKATSRRLPANGARGIGAWAYADDYDSADVLWKPAPQA
jgi:hypothetical protein